MLKRNLKRISHLSSRKFIQSGLLVFLREILLNPKAMGAAFPSSLHLARVIAKQIPSKTNSHIVELGGGTGVITAALLAHGINPEKLIIIERSAALALHLQKRFPESHVINGDARELSHLLTHERLPVNIIVSSLPLRSLPQATVKMIGKQIEQVLAPQGLFIQFTYGLFSKPRSPSMNLKCVYSKRVWRNPPPARVDVFCKSVN
jgi:phosphatidylethanolamine/phosphatidyl-N-methylethanolamine N-methyltransferase